MNNINYREIPFFTDLFYKNKKSSNKAGERSGIWDHPEGNGLSCMGGLGHPSWSLQVEPRCHCVGTSPCDRHLCWR